MAAPRTLEEVISSLTLTVGRICTEVAKYKVILAEGDTIPKEAGPFILVDASALDLIDWETEELQVDGKTAIVRNYTATYTLTAYRGSPYIALAKVAQSFSLPFLYYKYFPTGSPFAYSSTSTISKYRVPLGSQVYEDRARVQIIFNVAILDSDVGAFEDLDKIEITMGLEDANGNPLEQTPVVIG